jgi:hypothetical protein
LFANVWDSLFPHTLPPTLGLSEEMFGWKLLYDIQITCKCRLFSRVQRRIRFQSSSLREFAGQLKAGGESV